MILIKEIYLFPFNDAVKTGVLVSSLGNADLTWESTTSINAGLDFGFIETG